MGAVVTAERQGAPKRTRLGWFYQQTCSPSRQPPSGGGRKGRDTNARRAGKKRRGLPQSGKQTDHGSEAGVVNNNTIDRGGESTLGLKTQRSCITGEIGHMMMSGTRRHTEPKAQGVETGLGRAAVE